MCDCWSLDYVTFEAKFVSLEANFVRRFWQNLIEYAKFADQTALKRSLIWDYEFLIHDNLVDLVDTDRRPI